MSERYRTVKGEIFEVDGQKIQRVPERRRILLEGFPGKDYSNKHPVERARDIFLTNAGLILLAPHLAAIVYGVRAAEIAWESRLLSRREHAAVFIHHHNNVNWRLTN